MVPLTVDHQSTKLTRPPTQSDRASILRVSKSQRYAVASYDRLGRNWLTAGMERLGQGVLYRGQWSRRCRRRPAGRGPESRSPWRLLGVGLEEAGALCRQLSLSTE